MDFFFFYNKINCGAKCPHQLCFTNLVPCCFLGREQSGFRRTSDSPGRSASRNKRTNPPTHPKTSRLVLEQISRQVSSLKQNFYQARVSLGRTGLSRALRGTEHTQQTNFRCYLTLTTELVIHANSKINISFKMGVFESVWTRSKTDRQNDREPMFLGVRRVFCNLIKTYPYCVLPVGRLIGWWESIFWKQYIEKLHSKWNVHKTMADANKSFSGFIYLVSKGKNVLKEFRSTSCVSVTSCTLQQCNLQLHVFKNRERHLVDSEMTWMQLV